MMTALPARRTAVKKVSLVAPEALGVKFREARIELGLDFISVANHASVSIETVRRLETEPQRVPLQDLYAVANLLNLDPGVVLELLHTALRS